MVDRLPPDLLRSIGLKLEARVDRIRFRAVSKTWRSALPFRQPPWLLLLTKSPNAINLISAGEGTMHRIADFPEIHQAHGVVVGCAGKWIITWLISVTSTSKTIHLSNPFSKVQIPLPSTFQESHKVVLSSSPQNSNPTSIDREIHLFDKLLKVVLSSSPRHDDGTDKDFIAMSILNNVFTGTLAIVRPGDASWTTVAACPGRHRIYFEDCVFYQQQFYAIGSRGELVVCDVGDGLKPPQFSSVLDCLDETMSAARRHYLVEWSGELLMVIRFIDKKRCKVGDFYYTEDTDITTNFKIYKLDLVNRKFVEVKCLGDRSLFLGINTSVSVLVSDYFGLVRKNCVYFADDFACRNFIGDDHHGYEGMQTKNDIGVFDMEEGTITPHYKGTSYSDSNSIWIIAT